MDHVEETWDDEFIPAAPRSKPHARYFNDVLIDIDSKMIGKFIGKGGATIKGIKQESGAFISVIDSVTYGMKTVKISGSQKAKGLAQKLVEDFIKSNEQGKLVRNQPVQEVTEPELDNDAPLMSWEDMKKQHEENVKKRLAALPPIVKSFYKEHPEIAALSDKQVEDFRLSMNNIMVQCLNENNDLSIPKPVMKFTHAFQDYPEIMKEIKKQNFKIPSPVQCQAWPVIMSGHDLIAIAQTGTGKTLAFLLPAFIHINVQHTPREQRKGPTVLVLAPTRELVVQIESEVKKYSYKGIKSMSIYGGVSSDQQQERLQEGVEIIIATPGRLNDFVHRGLVDLSDVSYLILDEADRMLDLGFEPQIRLSLLKIRPNRQTIMTSATWPSGVKRLAKSYTNNPIQIMVGSLDLTTVNTVKQEILIMDQEEKMSWLFGFLENITKDKVIIFVNRKMDVDELSIQLSLKHFGVDSIHGGREQADREMALDNLRSGDVRILIATDVASRGIDIDDVTIIINYDLPKDIEEYVHRIGRAGRAGKTGSAITLMTKYDWSKSKDLVELLEKSGQTVPQELYDMEKRFAARRNKEGAERGNRHFRGSGRGFSRGNGSSFRQRNNW